MKSIGDQINEIRDNLPKDASIIAFVIDKNSEKEGDLTLLVKGKGIELIDLLTEAVKHISNSVGLEPVELMGLSLTLIDKKKGN